MIRLGLCCIFREEPIRFRSTTATYLKKRADKLHYVSTIILDNAHALLAALEYCAQNGIGAFRITSTFCPVITHPDVGYSIEQLPDAPRIVELLEKARTYPIRLTMHPDQYIVLNSPKEDVVNRSLADVEYHAKLLDIVGGDVITLHGGGGYGDKQAALARLRLAIDRLSPSARAKLVLENDDTVYTPADLLPFCRDHNIPFIYDVHHHRCLPDGLSIEEVTEQAIATWKGREPLFHISSPMYGWDGKTPSRHSDYIDPEDFPKEWKDRSMTLEVEAKAKELAVLRLAHQL